MPRENMTSKPGNAPIKQLGQTTSGKFGTDPSFRGKNKETARPLKAK